MDLVAHGPLRAASLLWQPRAGLYTLTVVCKATFQLLPGESVLLAQQELPNEEDNHWNDDPSRSLYSPSDLVPLKPRADVLLVGNAFAPGQQPVRSLVARLVVGTVDKSLEVFGDRSFAPDGQLREGARFVRMPIRYERAAGGPDTANPVGLRSDAPPGASRAIPNLQPLGISVTQPEDHVAPIGLGPIAPTWPARWSKLGRHAGSWPGLDWTSRPIPEDIDRGYFNAAPPDQQVESLRDNERIVLENLHPEHPRLVTSLPGLRPRAMIERHGAAPEELPMRPDTLWIDTDRGLCTVTWRGQLRLRELAEPGRVVIVAEQGGGPLAAPVGSVLDEDAVRTMIPLGPSSARATLPFLSGRPEDSPMAQPQPGEMKGPSAGMHGDDVPQTMLLSPAQAKVAVPLPFEQAPAPAHVMSAVPPVPPGPMPAPQMSAVPPGPMPAQLSVAPPAVVRPPENSPWGSGGPAARPLSIGEQAVAPTPNVGPLRGPAAVGAGALGASNQAAGPQPAKAKAPDPAPLVVAAADAPAPPKAPPREVVKLLWFDPAVAPRLRKQAQWRRLLLESDLAPASGGEADYFEEETVAAQARRHVVEVLTRGEPIDGAGVRAALAGAARDDGRFETPLVLVAGELHFPFDELETLKAIVTAVTPLMMGDAKLKELVEAVNDLLRTPWLEGSGPLAEGLTQQVRDLYGQGKRALTPAQLATHVERILLQRRGYQKRVVFGQECLRGLLVAKGGGEGVPAYLPAALGKELPMVLRVRARVLAEVEGKQDVQEAAAVALRVVGVARVMDS